MASHIMSAATQNNLRNYLSTPFPGANKFKIGIAIVPRNTGSSINLQYYGLELEILSYTSPGEIATADFNYILLPNCTEACYDLSMNSRHTHLFGRSKKFSFVLFPKMELLTLVGMPLELTISDAVSRPLNFTNGGVSSRPSKRYTTLKIESNYIIPTGSGTPPTPGGYPFYSMGLQCPPDWIPGSILQAFASPGKPFSPGALEVIANAYHDAINSFGDE